MDVSQFGNYDKSLPFWNQLNLPNKIIDRFWENVTVPYNDDGKPDVTSCWLIEGWTDRDGYVHIFYQNKQCFASRFIYQCFHGPITEPNIHICHTCDVRKCVNPYHLWKGTNRENTRDRYLKNRSAKGEQNGTSKLTETDIRNIMIDIEQKKYSSIKALARAYNISNVTLSNILSGKIWKHITKDYNLKILKEIITCKYASGRLTENQVLEIVELYNSKKFSKYEISKKYNICQGSINAIVCGRYYSEITGINYEFHKGHRYKKILNAGQAIVIRQRLANGETGKSLAKEYGVSQMVISRIKNNLNYNINDGKLVLKKNKDIV